MPATETYASIEQGLKESTESFENIETTFSEETSQQKSTKKPTESLDDVMNSLRSTTIQNSDTMDENDCDETTDQSNVVSATEIYACNEHGMKSSTDCFENIETTSSDDTSQKVQTEKQTKSTYDEIDLPTSSRGLYFDTIDIKDFSETTDQPNVVSAIETNASNEHGLKSSTDSFENINTTSS